MAKSDVKSPWNKPGNNPMICFAWKIHEIAATTRLYIILQMGIYA